MAGSNIDNTDSGAVHSIPPRFVRKGRWKGYTTGIWPRADKKNVTVLYSFVERRKSFFLRAWFKRNGYRFIDMGDHVKEDVSYGREYGNRMECNPMYFTSGSLIRHLLRIEEETGLSREEIARRYIFLCGGGQCGPCRYGMYPQEYLKAANDAGFKGLRILIFSSDLVTEDEPGDAAFRFTVPLRINMGVSVILSDLMHAAECALRAHALDRSEVAAALCQAEEELLRAFESRLWYWKIPAALSRIGRRLRAIARHSRSLPLVFVTGEFFANLAHNDGNYHLRRFITDEGCEVMPGSFTQRMLYDNWRRTVEATRGIRYAAPGEDLRPYYRSLRKQRSSTKIIQHLYNRFVRALNPAAFGARTDLYDLDELARIGADLYHPHIFGGEGNLEISEAIHFARNGLIDGFISSKPFGCMPSSGVSDGVQAKVMSMYPELLFLSIETSGDNDVNILSRVSMLLMKARQHHARRMGLDCPSPVMAPGTVPAPVEIDGDEAEVLVSAMGALR
jgi:predicted nucleotide-binding protein (sugar kinase/HSP70/actin superfamily)